MNTQPTSEPTTPTNVHAEENNDNQVEFTNPFCTSVLENAESSSRNIVQTRLQLATDPEMCMFALTVSTAEPKNIKEAMVDSTWIVGKPMLEENFISLTDSSLGLVDIPLAKNVFQAKCCRLEDVRIFVAYAHTSLFNLSGCERETVISYGPLKESSRAWMLNSQIHDLQRVLLKEEEAEAMAETMEQYMSKTRTDFGSGVARPNIEEKDSFELKGPFLKELRDKKHLAVQLMRMRTNTFRKLDVPTRQILDSIGVVPTKTAADAKKAIQEMGKYSQKWNNGTSRGRSTETSDRLAAIQA
ncbi:hypothetical protein Tco_1134795 [Tanacetum coccineum]